MISLNLCQNFDRGCFQIIRARLPDVLCLRCSRMAKRKRKASGLAAWIETNILLPDVVADPGPIRLSPYVDSGSAGRKLPFHVRFRG